MRKRSLGLRLGQHCPGASGYERVAGHCQRVGEMQLAEEGVADGLDRARHLA